MQLRLSNPTHTDGLATFLRGLGQTVCVRPPNRVEVDARTGSAAAEIQIYLRVWRVLYPDGAVQVESGEDDAAA